VVEAKPLSEDQKELLHLIAEGLVSRRKGDGPWWIRMAHDHSMPVWQNVRNPRLWRELQEKTDLTALVAFESCGFIESAQPGRYGLVEERILEAAARDSYADGGIGDTA
jgi:hypothetical protein